MSDILMTIIMIKKLRDASFFLAFCPLSEAKGMDIRVKDKSFTPKSLCLRCIHKLCHAQKSSAEMRKKMKIMQSFLIFFYILDQGYDQCKEDDLGGFLGAISPELWGDGLPIDKAIFNDWQEISNPETADANNIVERTYAFLEYYEREFGFDFLKTKSWLLTSADRAVVEKAYDEAQFMYQRFQYDN